jgi:hypothetical protein
MAPPPPPSPSRYKVDLLCTGGVRGGGWEQVQSKSTLYRSFIFQGPKSLDFQSPKKSRFSGPPFQWPSNSKWICPHQNHYVPCHINNRYSTLIVNLFPEEGFSSVLEKQIFLIDRSWTIAKSISLVPVSYGSTVKSWHKKHKLPTWVQHGEAQMWISIFQFTIRKPLNLRPLSY